MADLKTNSRRSRQRSSSYVRGRRNVVLGRILLAVVVLPLIFGGIFLYAWMNQEEVEPTEYLAEKYSAGELIFEEALQTGQAGDLMRLSARIQNSITTVSLPDKQRLLTDRLRLSDRIQELAEESEDETYINYAKESRLDSLVLLDALNLIHDFGDTEIRPLLTEETQKLLNSDVAQLRMKAHIAINQANVQTYIYFPTDENYEVLRKQMEESLPEITEHLGTVQSFNRMLEMLYTSKQDEKIQYLHRFVGDELRKHPNEIVWKIGTRIHDRILVGRTNFESLLNLLSIPDESAIEDLKTLADFVAQNRIGSPTVYRDLIESCECLSQAGRPEIADNLLAKLKESVSLIQDEVTINHVELMFEMLEKRRSLVGTTFQLSGSDINDRGIDSMGLEDKVVVVIFFSMYDDNSTETLKRFKELGYVQETGVRFVGCCGDAKMDEERFGELVKLMPELIFLNDETAEEYMKRCPVSFVPYIMILDREHTVIELNPHIDRVRAVLEQAVIRKN